MVLSSVKNVARVYDSACRCNSAVAKWRKNECSFVQFLSGSLAGQCTVVRNGFFGVIKQYLHIALWYLLFLVNSMAELLSICIIDHIQTFWVSFNLFCKRGRCELPQITWCIKRGILKKFINFQFVRVYRSAQRTLFALHFFYSTLSPFDIYVHMYVCLPFCLYICLSVFVYLSTRKSWFDYWVISLACRITSSFYCLTMDCGIKCEMTTSL